MSEQNPKVNELTEEEMDCVTGGDCSGSCDSCRFVTFNKTDQCMHGISGSCSGYCLCYGSVDCTGGITEDVSHAEGLLRRITLMNTHGLLRLMNSRKPLRIFSGKVLIIFK